MVVCMRLPFDKHKVNGSGLAFSGGGKSKVKAELGRAVVGEFREPAEGQSIDQSELVRQSFWSKPRRKKRKNRAFEKIEKMLLKDFKEETLFLKEIAREAAGRAARRAEKVAEMKQAGGRQYTALDSTNPDLPRSRSSSRLLLQQQQPQHSQHSQQPQRPQQPQQPQRPQQPQQPQHSDRIDFAVETTKAEIGRCASLGLEFNYNTFRLEMKKLLDQLFPSSVGEGGAIQEKETQLPAAGPVMARARRRGRGHWTDLPSARPDNPGMGVGSIGPFRTFMREWGLRDVVAQSDGHCCFRSIGKDMKEHPAALYDAVGEEALRLSALVGSCIFHIARELCW
jgi:hypothetical protein